ncbi:hypothetical protein FRX31_015492 [Thalictrum thalictroides]|uniref:Uncharacterized protein n=1 Tax=Thalictrum thalictroides TaxID=46969 RepID=A0A7J6WC70_THATH|nr:hypothetical protein FRX31_015492 [Thalictrum thalictroides]
MLVVIPEEGYLLNFEEKVFVSASGGYCRKQFVNLKGLLCSGSLMGLMFLLPLPAMLLKE